MNNGLETLINFVGTNLKRDQLVKSKLFPKKKTKNV